jgi:transposase
MNEQANVTNPSPPRVRRVIGFDAHPDTFTAIVLRGNTPAEAITEKTFHKVPLSQLESWTKKHTTSEDEIALEAGGNSFHIARTLKTLGRKEFVLESYQVGKLKQAHANNDKISAMRIGKAYLAGTAKIVWVPDLLTQERRDVWHAYRKTVQRSTRARNSLQSYLSDHGVRFKKKALTSGPESQEKIRQARSWSSREWQVIEGLLLELRHTLEHRAHWRSLIAQEVAQDDKLLSLVRLCGIRDLVAFAVGAIVGDINRFAAPKSLVNYVGLSPAFDDSGNKETEGGVGHHGRRDLRAMLVEAAQSIMRSPNSPLGQWGRKLLGRTRELNLVAAAVARKLTVAIWYLLMGRWTPLEEVDARLSQKLSTIITNIGKERLEKLQKTRQEFREAMEQALKKRIYLLDRTRTIVAMPA